MSTTTKTGIALVIVLVIVVIGWFVMFGFEKPDTTEVVEQNQEKVIVPTPVAKLPNTAGIGMSDVVDTSQEALQADINVFSTQMTELNTDTANIDAGLNEAI